ncbi:unnamed protein product [Amoebophrya sp. A120]|nr:unnamed protein product [Amoebophrya sp. A120]|eukprot:GSA120T00016004001.1
MPSPTKTYGRAPPPAHLPTAGSSEHGMNLFQNNYRVSGPPPMFPPGSSSAGNGLRPSGAGSSAVGSGIGLGIGVAAQNRFAGGATTGPSPAKFLYNSNQNIIKPQQPQPQRQSTQPPITTTQHDHETCKEPEQTSEELNELDITRSRCGYPVDSAEDETQVVENNNKNNNNPRRQSVTSVTISPEKAAMLAGSSQGLQQQNKPQVIVSPGGTARRVSQSDNHQSMPPALPSFRSHFQLFGGASGTSNVGAPRSGFNSLNFAANNFRGNSTGLVHDFGHLPGSTSGTHTVPKPQQMTSQQNPVSNSPTTYDEDNSNTNHSMTVPRQHDFNNTFQGINRDQTKDAGAGSSSVSVSRGIVLGTGTACASSLGGPNCPQQGAKILGNNSKFQSRFTSPQPQFTFGGGFVPHLGAAAGVAASSSSAKNSMVGSSSVRSLSVGPRFVNDKTSATQVNPGTTAPAIVVENPPPNNPRSGFQFGSRGFGLNLVNFGTTSPGPQNNAVFDPNCTSSGIVQQQINSSSNPPPKKRSSFTLNFQNSWIRNMKIPTAAGCAGAASSTNSRLQLRPDRVSHGPSSPTQVVSATIVPAGGEVLTLAPMSKQTSAAEDFLQSKEEQEMKKQHFLQATKLTREQVLGGSSSGVQTKKKVMSSSPNKTRNGITANAGTARSTNAANLKEVARQRLEERSSSPIISSPLTIVETLNPESFDSLRRDYKELQGRHRRLQDRIGKLTVAYNSAQEKIGQVERQNKILQTTVDRQKDLLARERAKNLALRARDVPVAGGARTAPATRQASSDIAGNKTMTRARVVSPQLTKTRVRIASPAPSSSPPKPLNYNASRTTAQKHSTTARTTGGGVAVLSTGKKIITNSQKSSPNIVDHSRAEEEEEENDQNISDDSEDHADDDLNEENYITGTAEDHYNRQSNSPNVPPPVSARLRTREEISKKQGEHNLTSPATGGRVACGGPAGPPPMSARGGGTATNRAVVPKEVKVTSIVETAASPDHVVEYNRPIEPEEPVKQIEKVEVIDKTESSTTSAMKKMDEDANMAMALRLQAQMRKALEKSRSSPGRIGSLSTNSMVRNSTQDSTSAQNTASLANSGSNHAGDSSSGSGSGSSCSNSMVNNNSNRNNLTNSSSSSSSASQNSGSNSGSGTSHSSSSSSYKSSPQSHSSASSAAVQNRVLPVDESQQNISSASASSASSSAASGSASANSQSCNSSSSKYAVTVSESTAQQANSVSSGAQQQQPPMSARSNRNNNYTTTSSAKPSPAISSKSSGAINRSNRQTPKQQAVKDQSDADQQSDVTHKNSNLQQYGTTARASATKGRAEGVAALRAKFGGNAIVKSNVKNYHGGIGNTKKISPTVGRNNKPQLLMQNSNNSSGKKSAKMMNKEALVFHPETRTTVDHEDEAAEGSSFANKDLLQEDTANKMIVTTNSVEEEPRSSEHINPSRMTRQDEDTRGAMLGMNAAPGRVTTEQQDPRTGPAGNSTSAPLKNSIITGVNLLPQNQNNSSIWPPPPAHRQFQLSSQNSGQFGLSQSLVSPGGLFQQCSFSVPLDNDSIFPEDSASNACYRASPTESEAAKWMMMQNPAAGGAAGMMTTTAAFGQQQQKVVGQNKLPGGRQWPPLQIATNTTTPAAQQDTRPSGQEIRDSIPTTPLWLKQQNKNASDPNAVPS